jgi:hypothetical protein
MARCKATIDCYPPEQCSRQAPAGKDRCWQHDRDRLREERDWERKRANILREMRYAQGDVDEGRRNVCDVVWQYLHGDAGVTELRGAHDALSVCEQDRDRLKRELSNHEALKEKR